VPSDETSSALASSAPLAEHFGAKNADERFELLLDIYVDGLARHALG